MPRRPARRLALPAQAARRKMISTVAPEICVSRPNPRRRFCLCLAFGVLAAASGRAPAAEAAAPLRIALTDRRNTQTDLSEAVLRRAYAEIGQPVEFVPLPSRRGLDMLLSGAVDGNAHRVAELAAAQPTLVRVDPPVALSEVRVYAGRGARLGGWAGLAGRRVTYQRGVLAIERRLPDGALRVEANDDPDAFRHLKAGLAEIAVIVEPRQAPPAALPDEFRRLDLVLETIPLHHYLHARHRAVAARLGEALQRLEASGELASVRQRVLQSAGGGAK